MIAGDPPQAREPVVEDVGLIDRESRRAAVEALARQDRHDRTGRGRRQPGQSRAADVAAHERTRAQELDEPGQPPHVRVAGTPDDRFGGPVGRAVRTLEVALGEDRGRGALEGDRRPEPTMLGVDREVPADGRRQELPGDPQGGGEQSGHPDQSLRLVVAGEEDRGRPVGVALVVLAVPQLEPLPGDRAVPGGDRQDLEPVRPRVAANYGVPTAHARAIRGRRGAIVAAWVAA